MRVWRRQGLLCHCLFLIHSIFQFSQNYKDKITDLLVDEVIEDAVQELEKLEDDVMVTSQAQMMTDAPTLENMLYDLEMMEVCFIVWYDVICFVVVNIW